MNNDLHIGFIGAGRVGTSLGRYFADNGLIISGYFSRSCSSAEESAEFTGSTPFSDVSELLSVSDTIFITAPDSAVTDVYLQLRNAVISGKMLCHCSGSLSAEEAFPDIALSGACGCSVHPLFPVSSRFDSFRELGNAFFCIEGDAQCSEMWRELLSSFGNKVRIISGEHKKKYHAACAVSSNLVCALAAESIGLLEQCGFSRTEALEALRPLAFSNLEHIFSCGPTAALTGPAERGDVNTVRKHIGCLSSDTDRSMYKAVTLKLLETAQLKNPDRDYSELRALLTNE